MLEADEGIEVVREGVTTNDSLVIDTASLHKSSQEISEHSVSRKVCRELSKKLLS